jgi:hypothetical protein
MTSIDAKFYGQEPTWDQPFADDADRLSALSKAYNWYAYMAKPEDHKQWVLDYMRIKNYDKLQIDRVRRLSNDEITLGYGDMPGCLGFNTGTMARLSALGAPMIPSDVEMLERVVQWLVNKPEPVKRDISVRPNVQRSMDEQLSRILGALEVEYDNSLTGKKSDPHAVLDSIKNVYARKISEYFASRLDELATILSETDKELSSAYAIYGKKNLKNAKQTVELIVQLCTEKQEQRAATPVLRRRRRKSPADIVKKLQYKKEDKAYGIVSIGPSKLVGAQRLLTFNTKYRTASLFEASGPDGLSIKGTTVIGFDPKKSKTKKLRKPAEFFKSIQGKGIRAVRAAFDSVRSTEKEAKGRINEEVILCGVFE